MKINLCFTRKVLIDFRSGSVIVDAVLGFYGNTAEDNLMGVSALNVFSGLDYLGGTTHSNFFHFYTVFGKNYAN